MYLYVNIFVMYILCIKQNYSPYLTMNQTGFNVCNPYNTINIKYDSRYKS